MPIGRCVDTEDVVCVSKEIPLSHKKEQTDLPAEHGWTEDYHK